MSIHVYKHTHNLCKSLKSISKSIHISVALLAQAICSFMLSCTLRLLYIHVPAIMALHITQQNSRPYCIMPFWSDAAVTGSTKGLAAGGNVSLSLPPLEKLCMALKAAAGETLATDEKTNDVMAMTDVTENAADPSTEHTAVID